MGTLSLYSSDVKKLYKKASFKTFLKASVNPSMHACFFIRMASNTNSKFLHVLLRNILIWKHSIDIGYGVNIGEGLHIPHPLGIVIGDGVKIGSSVTIYQNCTLGKNKNGYPVIKDGVCIYPGSIVVGGIVVGENCQVGANSYLDKSLDDGLTFFK